MTKWLLRLQDYQYEFECKPEKINRWIIGLSENPSLQNSASKIEEVSSTSENSDETSSETDIKVSELKTVQGKKIYPISSGARETKLKTNEALNQLLNKKKENSVKRG